MRRILFVVLLIVLVSLPPTTASTATPDWTRDVGPGYITTSPVADEDRVFIRTSGFWTGEERPQVMAFDHDGALLWEHTNPNATQHDMAPLMLVSGGEGPCGIWPELLLVGWADGQYTAHHRENGTLVWSVQTHVDGWGITGSSLLDGDHVVVPLRNGMARYCLADGTADFQVELGLGWRNGVSGTAQGFWMGDEQGRLWHVNREGVVNQSITLAGSLRHAPLLVGDTLLLHAQTTTASELVAVEVSSLEQNTIASLGPSPAVPVMFDGGAIFADSLNMTSVLCSETCAIASSVSAHINGEMAWTSPTVLHAPVNTVKGGWMAVSVDENGVLRELMPLTTPYDGYGTAAPEMVNGHMFLGNDAGVLMAWLDDESVVNPDESSTTDVFGALVLIASLAAVAGLASTRSTVAAWRWLSVVLVGLALVMLPSLTASWNAFVTSPESTLEQDAWNETWPDSWRGTQVVVIEFEDHSLVNGGFVGHQTVLQLTEAACQDLALSLSLQSTAIGVYVEAINGTSASGWEYFVDGERGQTSVDDAAVDATSVLVWRLA